MDKDDEQYGIITKHTLLKAAKLKKPQNPMALLDFSGENGFFEIRKNSECGKNKKTVLQNEAISGKKTGRQRGSTDSS